MKRIFGFHIVWDAEKFDIRPRSSQEVDDDKDVKIPILGRIIPEEVGLDSFDAVRSEERSIAEELRRIGWHLFIEIKAWSLEMFAWKTVTTTSPSGESRPKRWTTATFSKDIEETPNTMLLGLRYVLGAIKSSETEMSLPSVGQ